MHPCRHGVDVAIDNLGSTLPETLRCLTQGGVVVVDPTEEGTDVAAVSQGFVAINPVSLDWTDYRLIEELERSRPHAHK